MHTARQLQQEAFKVFIGGRPSSRSELLPDWNRLDRLGVLVFEPFGAVGASHLIQLSITAFYDIDPQRRAGTPNGTNATDPAALYPEIYLFHVGGRYGDHSAFDFWPARKEVFLPAEPRAVLDALNDRAITRLLVPDHGGTPIEHEFKEPAAARDRIASVFAYGSTGRVHDADVRIAGIHSRTEANVKLILDPDRRYAGGRRSSLDLDDPVLRDRSWPVRTEARRTEGLEGLALAKSRRAAVRTDGLAVEDYRRIDVDQALCMLSPVEAPQLKVGQEALGSRIGS